MDAIARRCHKHLGWTSPRLVGARSLIEAHFVSLRTHVIQRAMEPLTIIESFDVLEHCSVCFGACGKVAAAHQIRFEGGEKIHHCIVSSPGIRPAPVIPVQLPQAHTNVNLSVACLL